MKLQCWKTGLAALLAGACCGQALAETGFEAYQQQMNREFAAEKDEFTEYKKTLLKAFKEYSQKTGRVWGKDNVLPDRTNMVSFQGDLNHRSVIDFEKGVVNVEIAVPLDQRISESEAQKDLEGAILKALQQGADKRPMQQLAQQPVSVPQGPPVLEGQVADDRGNEVDRAGYAALAEQLAGTARRKTIRGDDGKSRVVYEAQFRLVPDHIKKRAIRYQTTVNRYAEQQQVPAALVFAVIETESMFNPYARSPAPAFGLMQLVPTSGAREAYKYLYNRDRVVSDTYLYNPDNNIKLGTAFLNRLYFGYFKGIKSDQSRTWATIAAYNTGAGNVFKTFAGHYSRARFGSRDNWKKTALREINRRSPEQVYAYMRRNLPYRETRGYIVKVRERIPKYTAI